MKLSVVGLWSSALRCGDQSEAAEAAAELEELGYSALWIPDVGGRVFDSVEHLLSSTTRTVIATGILNLWMHTPTDVANSYASLTAAHGDWFLLGIGVSHASLIDSTEPGRYRKPLAATRSFLDALDGTEQPVRAEQRVLAALGPKMLQPGGETRGRGPPVSGDTRAHRPCPRGVGDGPLLLPEQDVILCDGREAARVVGSDWLRSYLALPNYADNLLRLGFSSDDLASVSDRLFDGIIAWGDKDAILRRVSEHQVAGADHVCIQALEADPLAFPHEQWRRIAAAL